jgi:hypothetical protein
MSLISFHVIQVDLEESPIMWMPDPVTALDLAAALLSAIAAVLSIARLVRPKDRQDDRPDDDDPA